MTDRTVNGMGHKHSRTSKFLVSLILVVLFSLASWSYFYMKQMTLAPAETSVVVAFWLLFVFGVRWILAWISRHKRRTAHGKGR
jgi:uncharacterized membrane protein